MSMNTEKFIESVRSFQFLYDPNHEQFKDSKIKRETWHLISEEIGMECGDAAKMKWRNLKDCYFKYLKQGDSNRKYKKWPWAKKMDFLRRFIKIRERRKKTVPISISNTKSNRSNRLKQDTELNELSVYTLKESPHPESTNHHEITTGTCQEQDCQDTYNERKTYINDADLSILIQNLKERKDVTRDHVDNLFLSYANTFKQMSAHSQVELKLKMAQIFAEVEMRELEKPPSSPFDCIKPETENDPLF